MQNKNHPIGLSSAEAALALSSYGPNKIVQKKRNGSLKAIRSLFSPIPVMFMTAAGISYIGGKLFDFYFILFLMLLNFSVSFWQEHKADNAIEQLNALLKISVNVLRDGEWRKIDSESLVPGDIVRLFIGDVIPADLRIAESSNFSINEAAVTGESLPVGKKNADTAFSGSFVVTGQALAEVTATGKNSYFGKILDSIDDKSKRSLLEKDILSISKFLSLLSFAAIIVLSIVFELKRLPILEILTLDLSLVIAGIPIALPSVLTLIISLGVLKLSRENVVVRRLSSLEDLANVDLLFTDKTGTLTKNRIAVKEIVSYGADTADVLAYAYLASVSNEDDLINRTIADRFRETNAGLDFKIRKFIPADSVNKRSLAVADFNGQTLQVSVGAPQIIESLCDKRSFPRDKFEKDIEEAARNGYRALAVATSADSHSRKKMGLAGLILLSDELRQSAKRTIAFLQENGVKVKMITGDHSAIAKRIGKEVGLSEEDIHSEALPADKYRLVLEGKDDHIVAVTGDGVNDLPAVKAADVGFAVANAVGALKSSADIVLLSPGISVITTAIIEARKIFARFYSYSVYRISESLRLIITIFILGVVYGSYPLTPIQLILLALLNDIPIVSLSFNRVQIASKPAKLDVKKRFVTSLLFGMIGVLNSILFLVIFLKGFRCDWPTISTAFFLKLAIGGHLLVFVAHTRERWYRFLPSRQVIVAVLLTQALATILAVGGFLMHGISAPLAAFIWLWAIFWMQVSDYSKVLQEKIQKRTGGIP